MVIGVATDAQFATFCRVLGVESLASDPRYLTNNVRCENNPQLHQNLQAVIGTWPTETLQKAFKENGVPFSQINSIK